MNKYILPIILLFSFLNITKAQQITLGNTLNDICRESLVELPFNVSQTFEAGNVFTVQIKPYSGNTWTNLVTEGNSSPLKFTIPNSFNQGSYDSYLIRIISSKPSITSNEIFVNSLKTKPLVTLSGAFESIINPNEPAILRLQGDGAMPIKVVLDDSTSINVSYFDIYKGFPVYPAASKEYKIAYAENVCGRGVVSGNAKITVNEIGIIPILNSEEKVCIGGKFKLSYSVNGKFNENNKFKIVLRNADNANSKEYEVDAVEKDGVLEIVIPNNIPTGIRYQARISSSSPKAISTWTGQSYPILVGDVPSAEITTSNTKVNFGDWMYLNFELKGVGPWHITLNDGTALDYDLLNYTQSSYSFYANITPKQSKDIKISSVLTGCGVGTSSSKSVNIEVLNSPNITIETPKDNVTICVGESLEGTYSTSGDWGTEDELSAFVSDGQSELYTKVPIPATFKNGKYKITIPNNFFDKTSLTDFRLGVISKNGKISYSPYNITISTIPQVLFYNIKDLITIPSSGKVELPIYVKAIGNTTVLLDDSTSYTFYGNRYKDQESIKVNVAETTTFRIVSFSNLCGKVFSNDNREITVKVTDAPLNTLFIKSFPQRICVGANAKIYFKTTGNFDSNNDFKVELTSFQNNIPIVLGTAKTSPIEIKIPENLVIEDNNFYFIRVVATNPTLSTETERIIINKKPSAKLSVFPDDYTKGILPSTELTFNIDRYEGLSASNIFTFSDGSTSTGNKRITKTFSQSTTFTVISIKNECGENKETNNRFDIKVYPFTTASPVYFSRYECADKLLSYPYTVQGNMAIGTTFNLQIASMKDSIFRDVVTETADNPIRFKLPSNISDGNYYIRLVSNTNDKYFSRWSTFTFYKSPSIELTGKDGLSQVTIDGGNAADLVYQLKNSSEVFTNTVDNYNQSYPYNVTKTDFIQKVYPSKTTTYTLKLSKDNICGYGTVSGNVKVIVNPSVKFLSINTYSICPEKDILVKCSTYGEFGNDNVFKFYLVDEKKNRTEIGQSINLESVLNLKIPKTLLASTYRLEVSSTNPVLTKELVSELRVLNLPDVILAGNTIINYGQTTHLHLIDNLNLNSNFSKDISFTLSDNISRTVSYYGNKASFEVTPKVTTTYTVKSVSNICGVGKSVGSTTVTVNPIADKTTTHLSSYQYQFFCPGSTEDIYFSADGSFSSSNKFIVQISDKNGTNFISIPSSEGRNSPLKLKIPDDLPVGDNYRIRIIASDKDVSSAASAYPIGVYQQATAILDSTNYLFKEGVPITVKINLTGTAPWYIKFGIDSLSSSFSQPIYSSPYLITLKPTIPSTYKIFSISDVYCQGRVIGTGIVRVQLVTFNEELHDIEVKLFPNPTQSNLTIQTDNFKNTKLQIINVTGQQILEQELLKSETILDLSNLSTGVYFLQVNRENKQIVYKIQKL